MRFALFQIKASVRTVNPKEEKYMQQEPKFKISVSTCKSLPEYAE